MSVPTATYRLQFREGMDFDRAAGLAPYLRRLGISHLYASPVFQATPGSTHGYDVTDHNALDGSLGGAEGFLRLSAALREHELGLILDIVPNHMAASPANPWWRDVLRHGAESAYASHFDIDWSAPKLLVTVLGRPYGEALEAGEFALGAEGDGLVFRYYEQGFPLHPETWGLVLEPAGEDVPRDGWAAWIGDERNARRLGERLESLSADSALLHRVHEAQPWQLTYWRAARDMLTHRRFFEITDLVGVRVEDERVFDDVHRLLFEMVAEGHVAGIRVDHVDGLADPAGYLAALAEKAPGNPPVWVEKILAPDEALPDWPVEGTSGYEFARAVAAAATDPAGVEALDAAYAAFRQEPPDYAAMLREAKHEILTRNLAAELGRLTTLAFQALSDDPEGRDWGPDSLGRAIVALALSLPVYRTYLGDPAAGASPADDRLLGEAEREALGLVELDDPTPVSLLVRLLRAGEGEAAARFRTRFQQTTGALMAKAVEDTLFYRHNRLLSANEVGSEPNHPTLDAAAFHAEMEARLTAQPHGLSATATHDTKRGEDARMRIAAIAEAPEEWVAGVDRLEDLVRGFEGPEPEARWTFYQALLGAWEPEDPALAGRVAAFMVKAAREAKLRTSWVAEDEAYERTLTGFAERALGDEGFRQAFGEVAGSFVAMGGRKSLAQLGLKLTAPGLPDIYQGTERADLSLVDPDNRRSVDFALRERALDAPGPDFDGRKTALTHAGLLLRRAQPDLFAAGDYVPCEAAAPPHLRVAGFLRRHGDHVLAVAVELSGRGDGGSLRLRLPMEEPLEVLWAWPEGPGAPEGGVLDLTPLSDRGPVWMTLLQRRGGN
ncbi:MAG TPA: malto-oligosyltrehalose synthase [Egibacteraceae bacterium]|nr:malto-oligosyltrehalose synthase [Egibacteraceae bacterium]